MEFSCRGSLVYREKGGRRVQPSDRCGTAASPERPDRLHSYQDGSAHGHHTSRVLLVADVSVHRDSLVEQLGREPGIEVVGATSDLAEGVTEIWSLSPDLVLLDVAAEERVPAITALVAAIPEVRVVAFAVPETESEIIASAEAGVAACVTREASFAELVATIERVGSGESLCSPQVAAVLLRRVATLAAARSGEPAASLTSREREILELIDEGLSNKQIAQRLCIEVPTVKNHVHNLLEKLDVHSRYDAAALIRERAGSGSPRYAGALRI
jgi:two-component system, NarL family, nitrate/nitrite response regulator NarL